MGEELKHTFSPKELAVALIKNKNIHEGLWTVYVELKLVGINAGPDGTGDMYPAALVPITKFGIVHTAEATPLTVDASVVNPKPKQAVSKKMSKALEGKL